jgi:hypothetical protein
MEIAEAGETASPVASLLSTPIPPRSMSHNDLRDSSANSEMQLLRKSRGMGHEFFHMGVLSCHGRITHTN